MEANSSVFLIVALVVLISYGYWKYLTQLGISSFRSFDIIFLTILFVFLVGRIVGLLSGLGTDYQSIEFEQIVNFVGVRFAYLVVLFVPLLAYQFITQSLELDPKWEQRLPGVMIVSSLVSLVIIVFDAYGKLTSTDELASPWYYVLLAIVMLITVLVLLAIVRKSIGGLQTLLIVFFVQFVLLQLILWLLSPFSVSEVAVLSTSYLILFFLSIWPMLRTVIRRGLNNSGGSTVVRRDFTASRSR